jgi:hypothetical protein
MKRFLTLLATGVLTIGGMGCDVDVQEDATPDVDVIDVPDVDAPDTNIDVKTNE